MAEPNLLTRNNEKKIVVVGAGIAGLACGSRLNELGFTDVTILEARNRVGGRIYTENYGEHFIEIGAQWIHGEKNNSIFKIAQKNDLVDTSTNYMEDIMTFSCLRPEERKLVLAMISFLEKQIYEISDYSPSFPSIQNYLDYSFQEFIIEYNNEDLMNCLNRAYEWYCKFLCEHNGCISLSELSAPLFNNYADCDGNPTCELKYGYSSIINSILKEIPSHWILTNKIVSKIDWSEFIDNLSYKINNYNSKYSAKVKLLCTDGSEYIADHVVVTLPLGCLKKHSQNLFVPALSKCKQTAINALGFGVLNKIYLEFEEPFWKAPDVFTVLWNKSFDDILTKEGFKNLPHLQVWTHHINRFAYTQSHPNMLCAWIASEGAIQMESLSEEDIVEGCMTLLEALLGKKLPLPCKVLKSSWMTDPFSYGSFSYLSTECDKENVSNSTLAEPEYSNIHNFKYPVLLFAGEASHEYYFSTVHGGYETGLREADRIFRCYEFENLNKSFEVLSLLRVNEGESLKSFKVVLIGAGIAGLACAVQLVKSGFENVTILEAQEKVGGRISSVYCGNQVLELGAQWIHGTENELFKFSSKNNLLKESYNESPVEGQGLFCTSDGSVIPNAIVIEVKDKLNQSKIELEKGNYIKKTKKSVMSFLSEEFESHIKKCSSEEENLIKRSLFNWYIKFEVIDNGCDNLDNIAIQSFTEWDDCPNELYHIEYKSGFSSVMDTLLSKVSTDSIFLNKPVITVRWNKDFKLHKDLLENRSHESFPVILECKDGEIFCADTVIVTASAGFLKENFNTFFIPSLPDEKIKAFKNIGFGTINKIFLEFDKPFWSTEDLGFQLVWTNTNKRSEKMLNDNPWVCGITGFDVVKNASNVLVGWIGGEEAKLMEAVSEETVKVICTELLRMFLNRSDIPIASRILRSCWFNNPYVKGAYSNRTIDYYQNETSLYNLQYPLCAKYVSKLGKTVQWPILMFAGEALDKTSFSSAHGAFHSGLKAANYLLQTSMEVLDSELVHK